MAILTRRKTAAAALVVVGIAGLSIASAAQLNLDSEVSLGAGETVVKSCQPLEDDIAVSFENAYDAGSKAYNATQVKLSNIDEKCAGLNYKVTVVDGGAAEAIGNVTAGVTEIELSPEAAAAEVTDVAVVFFD